MNKCRCKHKFKEKKVDGNYVFKCELCEKEIIITF